jgi:hypothetical protein
MTKANLQFVHQELSLADRYDLLNMMPVSYEDFAAYTHLYGRMYGVITGEERGITGPDGEHLRGFVANACLRDALYRNLLTISEATEQKIGYKLSERYLTLDITWRGADKILSPVPGLERLEVTRNWYEIEDESALVTINYYTEQDLILFEDAGVLIARVSRTLFANPAFVYLYDETEGKMLDIDKQHLRYAERDGGDWLLPIITNVTAAVVTDTVHAFHQRHLEITVIDPDTSTLPESGEIKPVYPGTNQIIPHEIINAEDGETTYRFPLYVLVNSDFADDDDAIIWRRFETYKFYDKFELRYVVEEAEYLQMIWTEGDEQTIYQYDPDDPDEATLPRLKAVISDAANGTIHLYANDYLLRDLMPYWYQACNCRDRKMPQSVTLRIPLKVNPDYLSARHKQQIDVGRTAIISKVAAELPMEDCGCSETQIGFIYEQQKPYGKTYLNPYTGIEVVSTDYGMRHGQRIYDQMMHDMLIWRRPIRVGR